MDVGGATRWSMDDVVTRAELLARLARRFGRIEPLRRTSAPAERFRLADGTSVERKMSECHIAFAGKDGHTPVILGEPGDELPLLGVVTLEELGLLLNPFSRQLQPMQLLLM